jgi:hypothetical protein
MRFVLVKSEVAEALALSVDEFEERREDLEQLGFPLPLAGLGERWSIVNVINWVNRSNALAAIGGNAAARLPHTH